MAVTPRPQVQCWKVRCGTCEIISWNMTTPKSQFESRNIEIQGPGGEADSFGQTDFLCFTCEIISVNSKDWTRKLVACNAGKSQKMIALVEPGHALKTAPHLRKWGVGLRGFLGVGLGLRGVGLGWGCEASWACAHTVRHGVGLRGYLGLRAPSGPAYAGIP